MNEVGKPERRISGVPRRCDEEPTRMLFSVQAGRSSMLYSSENINGVACASESVTSCESMFV